MESRSDTDEVGYQLGSVHADQRDNYAYLKRWTDDDVKLNWNWDDNANPNYGSASRGTISNDQELPPRELLCSKRSSPPAEHAADGVRGFLPRGHAAFRNLLEVPREADEDLRVLEMTEALMGDRFPRIRHTPASPRAPDLDEATDARAGEFGEHSIVLRVAAALCGTPCNAATHSYANPAAQCRAIMLNST